MAKRKTVEAAEPTPVTPTTSVAEPKTSTRKAATKPSSVAGNAAHKHHAKKSKETTTEILETAPVAVAVSHEDVAKLAYSFWEAGGCQDGSAEQDWLRAERELAKLA